MSRSLSEIWWAVVDQALPLGRTTRRHGSMHMVAASGMLGLSLAAAGCHAGAEATVSAVRAPPSTSAAKPVSPALDIPGVDISSTAAKQEFAVEQALGADCPALGKDEADYRPTTWLPRGMCLGRIPAHVAHALAGISPETLDPSRADIPLRAIPGLGARADFWVDTGDGWIRSFEGPDPGTTVYVTLGKFCQGDRDASGECLSGLHVWRVHGAGAPVEVTGDIFPPDPVLTVAERAFYYDDSRGPSGPLLITDKLYYAPTMRWIMEFDSHDTLPANTPNRLNGNMAHLGFVRWTGTRFEARRTVPRAYWPCYPVRDGKAPCWWDEAAPDPYVTPDP